MSRAVLITGGSRGIGRAIVARFAGAGDHVLFSYGADDEGARRTQEQSPDALMHKADLRDPEAAQELMRVAVAQLGSVDVLVNCAGIFPHSPFLETTSDAVTDVLRVNVLAPFLLTQHAVAAMPEAGGAVVNVTSINAFSPDEGLAAYDASKAALAQITRTTALELGPRGVRVNAVAPGLVDDPTLAEAAPQRREAFLRHAPLGRLVQPQDIAHATYFLASDAAGAITGQTLVVDSGVTLAGYTAGG